MALHTLAVALFLFAMGVCFAIFEIEAEGRHGWAEKFPTWYRTRSTAAKIFMFILNKPLTGYHLPLFTAGWMIFFWPMVQTGDYSFANICEAVAGYLAWSIVWDFCWFVLNPFYGVKQFRKDRVWWFAQEPWIANRVPMGYISAWAGSIAIICLGAIVDGNAGMLGSHLGLLLCYVGFTVLLIVFGAPAYNKYYRRMRQNPADDDRSNARIFHHLK